MGKPAGLLAYRHHAKDHIANRPLNNVLEAGDRFEPSNPAANLKGLQSTADQVTALALRAGPDANAPFDTRARPRDISVQRA